MLLFTNNQPNKVLFQSNSPGANPENTETIKGKLESSINKTKEDVNKLGNEMAETLKGSPYKDVLDSIESAYEAHKSDFQKKDIDINKFIDSFGPEFVKLVKQKLNDANLDVKDDKGNKITIDPKSSVFADKTRKLLDAYYSKKAETAQVDKDGTPEVTDYYTLESIGNILKAAVYTNDLDSRKQQGMKIAQSYDSQKYDPKTIVKMLVHVYNDIDSLNSLRQNNTGHNPSEPEYWINSNNLSRFIKSFGPEFVTLVQTGLVNIGAAKETYKNKQGNETPFADGDMGNLTRAALIRHISDSRNGRHGNRKDIKFQV